MVTESRDPLIGLRVGGVKNNLEERGALLRIFIDNLRKYPNQNFVLDQIAKYQKELMQIEFIEGLFGTNIQIPPNSS